MEASSTVKQARDPALQLNDLRDALAIVNVIHEIAETMHGDHVRSRSSACPGWPATRSSRSSTASMWRRDHG